MKRLHAAIVTVALGLAISASAGAVERSVGIWYWPADQKVTVAEPSMSVASGGRVYFVVDDPNYDLSGSTETVFLVDDGSAFRAKTTNVPAGYVVAVNANPREVVTVPAEYRQDWMAVAAGDRPVRSISSSRALTAVPGMVLVPTDRLYARNGAANGTYRYSSTNGAAKAKVKARTKRTSTASTKMKARTTRTSYASKRYHKRSYSTASAKRRAPARYGYAATKRTAESTTNGAYYASEGDHGLYQVGNSWYLERNGAWYRSTSWKGPFAYVKTGTVPREVIEVSKKK